MMETQNMHKVAPLAKIVMHIILGFQTNPWLHVTNKTQNILGYHTARLNSLEFTKTLQLWSLWNDKHLYGA